MQTKRIEFQNKDGFKLSAYLEQPDVIKAYGLFVHCFTCNKNSNAAFHISKQLAMEGIGMLRFDFTGLGESEGDFADTNFASNVDDIISAVSFMQTNGYAPSLLIGHSLGGAAALAAVSGLPSVKALVTIAAPADPVHVMKRLYEKQEEIEMSGQATVTLGGRAFKVKKQFIDVLDDRNMHNIIHSLDRALLIMHSPQDMEVGIENAEAIYEAALHPKSFISLPGEHLLNAARDARYAGKVIAAWAGRYLGQEEE